MDEILKIISQSPVILTVSGILLLVLVLSVIVIYIVAFIQGRDISFWPPRIGKNTNYPTKVQNKSNVTANSSSKLAVDYKNIVLGLDAQNDCRILEISKEDIIDFILNEVSRHPVLFNSPFTSIPVAFAQNVVILSWNGSQVHVERVLTQTESYPTSTNWYLCVSLYRQAIVLPYRNRKAKPLIAEREIHHVINLYRKLLRNIKKFIALNDESGTRSGFDFPVFESLLEEAEFALFNENMDSAVVKLEALLSSIHKFLISNAPQIKPNIGRKIKSKIMQPTKKITGKDKKFILAIDDDIDLHKLLSAILKDKGYQLVFASGGEDALKAIVENNIDLALTDIMMPGIDGIEVARGIKIISPKTKILFLTGRRDDKDREYAKSVVSYSGYLSKPFNKNELYELIKKILE